MLDLRNGGEFISSFEVELDGGRTAVVTTTEETLQQLIQLAAGLSPGAAKEAPQRAPEPEYSDEEVPEAVFGGDDPGEMMGEESLMGRISDEDSPQDVTAVAGEILARLEAPKPARRANVDADGFFKPPPARTVEKDEMGYPIVPQTRTSAPSAGRDDDGEQM
jgi:hypothetical protein